MEAWFPELLVQIVSAGAILVLFVALFSAIFHLRQGVAFVPTPRRVTEEMVKAANLKDHMTVIDLGAGDGRLLCASLQSCGSITAIGYEGAFAVWLYSRFRTTFSSVRPCLRYANFLDADLRDADVVFAYLSISMMQKLTPKFSAELKSGALLISHAFSLHGRQPKEVRTVNMPLLGTSKIFIYQF